MRKLLAALLLFAAPASAFFTPQEQTEIRKVGTAGHYIGGALLRAGQFIDDGGGGTIAEHHDALSELYGATSDCFIAWGHFVNSPGISGYFPADRSVRVQDAFSNIAECRNEIAVAISKWDALGATAVVSELNVADAQLASFDDTLSYMDWQPDSYPAVIGTHDSWDHSQRRLHRTAQYMRRNALGAAIGLYGGLDPQFADGCTGHLRNAFSNWRDLNSSHIRMWSLFSSIVYTEAWGGQWGDDATAVQSLANAGNNTRPPDFFNIALAAQYGASKDTGLPMIDGNTMKSGMNGDLFGIGASLTSLIACVSDNMAAHVDSLTPPDSGSAPEVIVAYAQTWNLTMPADPNNPTQQELDTILAEGAELQRQEAARVVDIYEDWLTSGSGKKGPQVVKGRVRQVVRDIFDGWNDLDANWGLVLNFFHGSAGPPPGGGGVICDPSTTTEVDGVCVGNPPPPPPTCQPIDPTFMIDGDTANIAVTCTAVQE